MKHKKNTLTKKERKIFAPLQAHEDRSRAFWVLVGAGIVMLVGVVLTFIV